MAKKKAKPKVRAEAVEGKPISIYDIAIKPPRTKVALQKECDRLAGDVLSQVLWNMAVHVRPDDIRHGLALMEIQLYWMLYDMLKKAAYKNNVNPPFLQSFKE